MDIPERRTASEVIEHALNQADALTHAADLWAIEGHVLTYENAWAFAAWAEGRGLIDHELADTVRSRAVKHATKGAESIEAETKKPPRLWLKRLLAKFSRG